MKVQEAKQSNNDREDSGRREQGNTGSDTVKLNDLSEDITEDKIRDIMGK